MANQNQKQEQTQGNQHELESLKEKLASSEKVNSELIRKIESLTKDLNAYTQVGKGTPEPKSGPQRDATAAEKFEYEMKYILTKVYDDIFTVDEAVRRLYTFFREDCSYEEQRDLVSEGTAIKIAMRIKTYAELLANELHSVMCTYKPR